MATPTEAVQEGTRDRKWLERAADIWGQDLEGCLDGRAGHLLLPFLSWERPRPRLELYHIIPNASEVDGKVWSCYPGQLGFDYPSSSLFYLDRSGKVQGWYRQRMGQAVVDPGSAAFPVLVSDPCPLISPLGLPCKKTILGDSW